MQMLRLLLEAVALLAGIIVVEGFSVVGQCGLKISQDPLVRLRMTSDNEAAAARVQTKQAQKVLRTETAIRRLMEEHDPILLFASKLLPRDKAADASALYAWCRRLDEICDGDEKASPSVVLEKLGVWQDRFEALWTTTEEGRAGSTNHHYPEDDYLMDLALRDCIEKYQGNHADDSSNSNGNSLLTRLPFDDMIEGMKSDAVEERRVQSMDELEVYAYRVAGTVGLMLLPLLLSDTKTSREGTLQKIETAREPAICLGKAIQLVNILRDATQDAKLGRIYLPRDMLRDEGVDDQSILRVVATPSSTTPDGYKTVVRRVSSRARELLAIAEGGRKTLPSPLGPLFVQIIVELYRDYLEELDRRDYDNLRSGENGQDRVKIGTPRKILASLRAVGKVAAEAL